MNNGKKRWRSKLNAYLLIEAVVATVLLCIVVGSTMLILYESVWTGTSFSESEAFSEFISIEHRLRGGQNIEHELVYAAFHITTDKRLVQPGLWQVDLVATDAGNHTIGSYRFLCTLVVQK